MDVFGLTPIDASLSALGLNFSYQLTQVLFLQTPIGALSFIVGFLWALWQSAKESNFKYVTVWIFISLTGIFLCILPQRIEPAIKSAAEAYGSAMVSAQSLKDAQTQENTMPVMLSFASQMADSIGFASIYILDLSLDKRLRFLTEPFNVQKLSLKANLYSNAPLPDTTLRSDLESFIYAEYVPALKIYTNNSDMSDLGSLWVGDGHLMKLYSSQGRRQWDDIKLRLQQLIDRDWAGVKDVLNTINPYDDSADAQIMSSIVHSQSSPQSNEWLSVAVGMQNSFIYVLGGANFLLFAAFPFLMLSLIIFRRMNILLRYAEVFVWIKFWPLCAAMSYHVSLLAARVQGQTAGQISWFWESPYYVVVASAFLVLMPCLAFWALHHGFQLIHK